MSKIVTGLEKFKEGVNVGISKFIEVTGKVEESIERNKAMKIAENALQMGYIDLAKAVLTIPEDKIPPQIKDHVAHIYKKRDVIKKLSAQALESKNMCECKKCGELLDKESNFCPECGKKLDKEE